MSVLPNLGGDGGTELGGGNDVVQDVDFHDGRDGSARSLEELEHALTRLRQARRVRRHAHVLQRRRHLDFNFYYYSKKRRLWGGSGDGQSAFASDAAWVSVSVFPLTLFICSAIWLLIYFLFFSRIFTELISFCTLKS